MAQTAARRRALAESAKAAEAFFATVTKLDGTFGFGTLDPGRDPVHGALAGLSKSASHEWPKVACKAIDIDPGLLRHAPLVLVEEILTTGPLEVGLSSKGRMTLELVDAPAVLPAGDAAVLAKGDVVVVSGGARGVTAEAIMPLVRAAKPKLVLLGRTAPTDAEPEWLAGLTDEAEIKQRSSRISTGQPRREPSAMNANAFSPVASSAEISLASAKPARSSSTFKWMCKTSARCRSR